MSGRSGSTRLADGLGLELGAKVLAASEGGQAFDRPSAKG